MKAELIEGMPCLLDVRLHALALCAVSPGVRLRLPPMDSVPVHYMLRGEGLLQSGDSPPIHFTAGTLIFMPQKIGHDMFTPEAEKKEARRRWSHRDGLRHHR